MMGEELKASAGYHESYLLRGGESPFGTPPPIHQQRMDASEMKQMKRPFLGSCLPLAFIALQGTSEKNVLVCFHVSINQATDTYTPLSV